MIPKNLIERGQYWTEPWNPIRVKGGGFHCTKISPGCKNCWAESMNLRGGGKPYDGKEYEYEIAPGAKNIYKMKNEVVAVQWMSDLFHQDYPTDLIRAAWHDMNEVNDNIYLVLTKRIERFLSLAQWLCWTNSDHIYVGVSVESPGCLYRLEELMKWPGKKFVSIEPCLGAVDLSEHLTVMTCPDCGVVPVKYWTSQKTCGRCMEQKHLGSAGQAPPLIRDPRSALDQVIIGCESGAGRRQPPLMRNLLTMTSQCKDAGVPVFVKQWDIGGIVQKMPIFNGGVHGVMWDELVWSKGD